MKKEIKKKTQVASLITDDVLSFQFPFLRIGILYRSQCFVHIAEDMHSYRCPKIEADHNGPLVLFSR